MHNLEPIVETHFVVLLTKKFSVTPEIPVTALHVSNFSCSCTIMTENCYYLIKRIIQ